MAGALGLSSWSLLGQEGEPNPALARAIGDLEYLTRPEDFREFSRERPRIDELPPERLREVGLHPDTWQLEVVPEAGSNCEVERILSKEQGAALDWQALMKLAETHAVQFLKVMTCTNMAEPIGMGLWEGVPLRDVVWLTRPRANIRRVYYYGYHNDDPKQRFQSSLPIGRVLEDPPGELPVILCYKLNGRPLPTKCGGPVRVVAPEAYGNKSVKWVQRVVLTDSYQANDTYAEWGNDVESPMKTCARFIAPPDHAEAGQAVPLVGYAQVGMSGLSKVQCSVERDDAPRDPDDPYFSKADWRDAQILPPTESWGGGLPEGRLAPVPLQFDAETGKPRTWPLRYTIVHWAALLAGLQPGRYRLRCRTIDADGAAQPMPRPLPKSGRNDVHEVALAVEG